MFLLRRIMFGIVAVILGSIGLISLYSNSCLQNNIIAGLLVMESVFFVYISSRR